jgi:hypothetical protein
MLTEKASRMDPSSSVSVEVTLFIVSAMNEVFNYCNETSLRAATRAV